MGLAAGSGLPCGVQARGRHAFSVDSPVCGLDTVSVAYKGPSGISLPF